METEMVRRSKIQIMEEFVTFLKKQGLKIPFFKSAAVDEKLGNALTVEEWFDLIILAQSAPKIRKIKLENNVLYEVIDE